MVRNADVCSRTRENGVAYSVDVECAENTDVRCTSDAFVTELTNHLVYVGGGAAR
jgi:hypothetical protein